MAFILSPLAAIPLVLVASPLLVWLGAVSPNPRWLEGFAGQAERLSYGIYLLHYPIIMTFVGFKVLGTPQSVLAILGNYLLVLATVILVAHVASSLLTRTGRLTIKLLSAST
jgi:peptidoglycan/LPS O-acetylase OafA/YrhL